MSLERATKLSAAAGSIDEVDYVDGLPGLVRHRAPLVVPLGAPLRIRGWALDAGRRELGASLQFKLGPTTTTGAFSEDRTDIAAVFESTSLARCGYTVGISTVGLVPGYYDLQALILLYGDETAYPVGEQGVWLAGRFEQSVEPNGIVDPQVRSSIDALEDRDRSRPASGAESLPVSANAAIELRGWVSHATIPIVAVRARVEGIGSVLGFYGNRRDEIARLLGREDQRYAGFTIPIRLDGIPPGRRIVSVEYQTSAGWLPLFDRRAIMIVPPADAFPIASRRLAEPLVATIDKPHTSIEIGRRLLITGSLDGPAVDGVYLQILSDDQPTTPSNPPLRYAMDYPIITGSQKRRFSIDLPTTNLRRGGYTASIVAPTPDRRGYRESDTRFSFCAIAPRARPR